MNGHWRSTYVVVFFSLVLSELAVRAESLDPKNTYAVVVGVLSWKDRSFSSFSTVGRKDQELFDTLLARGVPKENTALLLDRDATRDRIRSSLKRICTKAKAGSTLIFYYAGHGTRAKGTTYYASYDMAAEQPQTGLAATDISKIAKQHFTGRRVLLLADCCHSGGATQATKQLNDNGFEAACLTSAAADLGSTGNWTYTHCLVDMFGGEPTADANHDGKITLAEAAAEVRDAMKFLESQRFGFATHGLPDGFVLAETKQKASESERIDGPFAMRDYVQARLLGYWLPGRIIGFKNDKYVVRFQRYSARHVASLPAEQLREPVINERVALAEPPKPLGEKESLTKASVDGKYTKLLKKFKVEEDFRSYTEFNEWGHWTGNSWGGHDDLPPGYWVYVYPNWYIWGEKDGAAAPEPARVAGVPAEVPAAGKRAWGPEQVTGRPDTPFAGDAVTAWASATPDGQDEWLELEYKEMIIPTQIIVHANYNPGALYRITGFSDAGEEFKLWEGDDPVAPTAEQGVSRISIMSRGEINRIRVYLKSTKVADWNEIDAVGIKDDTDKIHWASKAKASSTYADLLAGVEFSEEAAVEAVAAPSEKPVKELKQELRELRERLSEIFKK